MIRRFLDSWMLLMTAVVATLMAVFWWTMVNHHTDGRLSAWALWAYDRARSLLDRLLAGPRAEAFRTWSQRFWKEVD